MSSILYILGRTPDLAFWELKTFLPDVSRLQTNVAMSAHSIPIAELGGTVKIAEVVETPFVDEGSTFGVSVYGAPQVPLRTLREMKEHFHATRFVATKGEPLSSVVITKNKLQEIIMVKQERATIFAKTLAVQPFEEWNMRDFGRPYADPKAGMLPPKVARMAVNIAGIGKEKTLLDPFCGMGTILCEASAVGWKVIGADYFSDVVHKAEGNLKWLGVTGYELYVSDATHVSQKLSAESVDAIVTEPFMGPPKINNPKNTIKGLEKLFIGCLRDWQKVLKPHSVVVMAIPKYELKGKTYFVKKVIDMCENLGYTIQAGPIEYGRPGATVKRLFYLFQKSKELWHT